MAQLGDLIRARTLLRAAARAFASRGAMAHARCIVAEAEIALVSRELDGPMSRLGAARAVLEAHGDPANAAHAGYLQRLEERRVGKALVRTFRSRCSP